MRKDIVPKKPNYRVINRVLSTALFGANQISESSVESILSYQKYIEENWTKEQYLNNFPTIYGIGKIMRILSKNN